MTINSHLLDGPRLEVAHEAMIHIATRHGLEMPGNVPRPDGEPADNQRSYFRLLGFVGADATEDALEAAGLVVQGADDVMRLKPGRHNLQDALGVGRDATRATLVTEAERRIDFYRSFLEINDAIRPKLYDPPFHRESDQEGRHLVDNAFFDCLVGCGRLLPVHFAAASRNAIEVVGPTQVWGEVVRLDKIVNAKRSRLSRAIGRSGAGSQARTA